MTRSLIRSSVAIVRIFDRLLRFASRLVEVVYADIKVDSFTLDLTESARPLFAFLELLLERPMGRDLRVLHPLVDQHLRFDWIIVAIKNRVDQCLVIDSLLISDLDHVVSDILELFEFINQLAPLYNENFRIVNTLGCAPSIVLLGIQDILSVYLN